MSMMKIRAVVMLSIVMMMVGGGWRQTAAHWSLVRHR